MIRINLLPHRRAKLRLAASRSDSGSKELALGIGGLVAASALVFLLVDMPRRTELRELKEANAALNGEIASKQKDLVGYAALQKEETDADAKIQAINRLLDAKVVPANVLHELGKILTTAGPTMTARMAALTDTNSNKEFQKDWDPTKVWLTGFADKDGVFKLEGGAQSKEDVTQLSKRLAASVYFENVVPQGGERATDVDSGLTYYKFTITGKVAY